jgi:hypothetical protein
MNLDHIDKNLLAKIQKLMKLQEGAKAIGNFEEAANAAERIREMLMKYNLEMYQVEAAGDLTQKKEATSHQEFDADDLTKPHEGRWIQNLAKTIANYNMCAAFSRTKGTKMVIIGTPSNVEIVWYTCEMIANLLRPAWKIAFKAYTGHEKRNTFMRGFLDGGVKGIAAQLAERQAKEVWEAKQVEQSVNEVKTDNQKDAVMRINMQLQAQKENHNYAQTQFRMVSGGTHKGLSGQNGKAQGFEHGKNMSLNKGLTHPGKVSSEKWLN